MEVEDMSVSLRRGVVVPRRCFDAAAATDGWPTGRALFGQAGGGHGALSDKPSAPKGRDAVERTAELDQIWDDFHSVVNMTSRELREWLMTRSAAEDTEPLPDEAGTPTGRHVVEILGKRKTDLTDDDVRVMRRVVAVVRAERGEQPEPTAGQQGWRHRLMTLGHDPLKPER
jgi:hypothetical protein